MEKEVNARGGGGGEYFTFLGSFCAATHIIDKACSMAVIKQISVTQRVTKTYLMRSLYKLRLFEVILSKTADFSDSQLPCWDFALKHLRSRYSLSTRKPTRRVRSGSPCARISRVYDKIFLFGWAHSRPSNTECTLLRPSYTLHIVQVTCCTVYEPNRVQVNSSLQKL